MIGRKNKADASIVRDLPVGHDAAVPSPDWGMLPMPPTYKYALAPWRVDSTLIELYRRVDVSDADRAMGREASVPVVRDLAAPAWFVANCDRLNIPRSHLAGMVDRRTGLLMRDWTAFFVYRDAERERFQSETMPDTRLWREHDGERLAEHYAVINAAARERDRRAHAASMVGPTCTMCGLSSQRRRPHDEPKHGVRERHPLDGLPGVTDVPLSVCLLCAERVRRAALDVLLREQPAADGVDLDARVAELLSTALTVPTATADPTPAR